LCKRREVRRINLKTKTLYEGQLSGVSSNPIRKKFVLLTLLYFIPQKRKRTIKKAEGWLLTNFLSLSKTIKKSFMLY
jgi:hypothetical protein